MTTTIVAGGSFRVRHAHGALASRRSERHGVVLESGDGRIAR
jgi:hypothetical protein